MSWLSSYYYATSSECNATLFADGVDHTISTSKNQRVMDFGPEEQYIDDKLFEFIVNNASQLVAELEFLSDITMKKDLHVEGSAYVSDKKVLVEGDVTADTYTKEEIDAKFLADYVVSDETSTATLRKTGFFVSGNLEETEEYWAWSDEYGYTQTVWPSIRYDYSHLEPKALRLG
jgi:hypothetical protein